MSEFDFLMENLWQMIIILIIISVVAAVLPFLIKKIFQKKGSTCKCGYKINSSDKFCPRCGRELETENKVEEDILE